MNILLIGASGCGKGTQAKILVDKYGFCHLSMGDVLKEEVRRGTPEGTLINSFQQAGNLVPLEITLKALNNKIENTRCATGFILDGFPRTMEQVKALKLPIDIVINFNIDFDALKERLVNRRVCKKCNSNFHQSMLKNGLCPNCGGEVYQRNDDNEAAIDKRLSFYKKEAVPVVEYYRTVLPVIELKADKSVEDVAKQIETGIKKYSK